VVKEKCDRGRTEEKVQKRKLAKAMPRAKSQMKVKLAVNAK